MRACECDGVFNSLFVLGHGPATGEIDLHSLFIRLESTNLTAPPMLYEYDADG